MPIYEYDCENCGHRFEKLLKRTDEPVACPKCGADRVAKRFSTFSASTKGPPAAPA